MLKILVDAKPGDVVSQRYNVNVIDSSAVELVENQDFQEHVGFLHISRKLLTKLPDSPWLKSRYTLRTFLHYPQGLFVSLVYGDGQAAASRAAGGFVGGAYRVGHRSGTSIL